MNAVMFVHLFHLQDFLDISVILVLHHSLSQIFHVSALLFNNFYNVEFQT